MNLTLSPSQETALERLKTGLRRSNVVRLTGEVSRGKTTVLRALHADTGGAYFSVRDLVAAHAGRDPMGIGDTFFSMIDRALETDEIVYVDDVRTLESFVSCAWAYPGQRYINLPFKAIGDPAEALGRKLIRVRRRRLLGHARARHADRVLRRRRLRGCLLAVAWRRTGRRHRLRASSPLRAEA
jgi:hypothetical protein